jgi:hypothetical protein
MIPPPGPVPDVGRPDTAEVLAQTLLTGSERLCFLSLKPATYSCIFVPSALRQCLTWLALAGVFCWRQNAGSFAGTYKGKRRIVRFASEPGISDILGLIPPAGRSRP